MNLLEMSCRKKQYRLTVILTLSMSDVLDGGSCRVSGAEEWGGWVWVGQVGMGGKSKEE